MLFFSSVERCRRKQSAQGGVAVTNRIEVPMVFVIMIIGPDDSRTCTKAVLISHAPH